eukprot:CAMPEP_0175225820 /NCGR_PEP_ID=MMETSP0093-20121207/22578_1 /TAXON_ID=311494 /ORGANISM="Alexandrium monilatum, Strain CCMP3105" /LENGTH=73 /DNA_ID=CAMNT_0016519533 /DNA_START=76 /DNA_END=294 /DNA_ORIENTATION=+
MAYASLLKQSLMRPTPIAQMASRLRRATGGNAAPVAVPMQGPERCTDLAFTSRAVAYSHVQCCATQTSLERKK